VLDIQHIGSTSVPGLVAKPIIDIGIAVASFEESTRCIPRLEQIGYLYRGEEGIPRRHLFIKGEPRTHNVHMNEIHSADWQNTIAFRDYLRQHPDSARAYAALKTGLAQQFTNDLQGYLMGKADFISQILELAHSGEQGNCFEGWYSLSAHLAYPTPYPDVNAVLQTLRSSVQTILGDHFLGMYLDGSLAWGDFDPHTSDIDFIVVTVDSLPDKMLPALEAMHARIAASSSKWATELEGSYIPRQSLRRYDPIHALHPNIERGRGETLSVKQHHSDWVIHRHILREHGLTLAGPAPHTLIDPIHPDDLRRAVLTMLREWWAPMIHDPVRLHHSGYQSYAILTICRVLYTLQHGAVVSKPVAARWAQAELDERWSALIERAVAWGGQTDDVNETLDFIQYTLERSRQVEMSAWIREQGINEASEKK